MNKGEISIIVPIYNAEKYLERCVESILNSSYKELELILVDDGSTDSSSSICDRYANYDERVIVIHKENEGPELARKYGVAKCHGEYIMFVDADDYILGDIIEHGISALIHSGADIVCFDYQRSNGHQGFCIMDEEYLDVKSALKNMLSFKKLDGNLWCKIYRANVVKAPNVQFRNKRNCDFLTSVEIFENAEKICLLPECGYVYSITEGSLTNLNICHDREEEYAKEAEKFHNEFSKKYPDLKLASENFFLMALLFVAVKMEKAKAKIEKERYEAIHEKLKVNMKRYMKNPYITFKDKLQVILCRYGAFYPIWSVYSHIKIKSN